MNMNIDNLDNRGKQMIIKVPVILNDIIKNYQKAYKNRTGNFIPKEEVLYKLCWYGKDTVLYETDRLIKEYENYTI